MSSIKTQASSMPMSKASAGKPQSLSHARPEPIHFVDGVRCVEARIILDDESSPIIKELLEISRLVEVTILRRDNIYCSAGKWPVS
jgi:hypothetical protein